MWNASPGFTVGEKRKRVIKEDSGVGERGRERKSNHGSAPFYE